MLLVLLMTMATASLSASFAVFLVRERANKSKHIQVHTACMLCWTPLFFVRRNDMMWWYSHVRKPAGSIHICRGDDTGLVRHRLVTFVLMLQTVSGAPPTAFWGSVYLWDLINYAISAAGNFLLIISVTTHDIRHKLTNPMQCVCQQISTVMVLGVSGFRLYSLKLQT